jgi:hypothetical protein
VAANLSSKALFRVIIYLTHHLTPDAEVGHDSSRCRTAIEIEVCRFETINQIEEMLVELRYNVMFIKLPEETAFAQFFLKKTK